MKLLLAVGLLLAVTGTAGAVGLPAEYWVFGLRDWDMGSVYKDYGGDVHDLANTVPGPGSWNLSADRLWDYDWGTDTHNDTDEADLEDGWGIGVIDLIYYGKLDPTGKNIDVDTSKGDNGVYWADAEDDDNELVAMFHGLQDQSLTGTAIQVTEGTGFHFEIYQQPDGSYVGLGGDGQGSAGRLAYDQYKGVGYSALDIMIAGAQVWLEGESTGNVGFLEPFATSMNEWTTTFQPTVGGASGTVRTWLDVTGGLVAPLILGTEPFFDSGRSEAYLYLNMTTDAQNPYNEPGIYGGVDWTAQSNDDVVGTAIPEPVTIFGVGLAVVGLSGYTRKRRSA